MEAHHQLIDKFYSSFQDHDHQGMIDCYHKDVVFEDPAFGELVGKERVSAMWKMLLERAKGDLIIHFDSVMADEIGGYCHWEAHYHFSKSQRPVHNEIRATFRFQDGLIIEHHDHFSLWNWARMALGPTGTWLGWSPMVQNKIRRSCIGQLNDYMGKSAEA